MGAIACMMAATNKGDLMLNSATSEAKVPITRQHERRPLPKFRSNIVLIGFLAIGAFYLLTEHLAHVLGILPWLLVLACPLLHHFMHHGHHPTTTRRSTAGGGMPTADDRRAP